jgi:hypothetical protein
MNIKTIIAYLFILALCSGGCTMGGHKIIELEKREGKIAKLHVRTPYEPCSLHAKKKELIECEWKLGGGPRLFQTDEVNYELDEIKKVYHKTTYDAGTI